MKRGAWKCGRNHVVDLTTTTTTTTVDRLTPRSARLWSWTIARHFTPSFASITASSNVLCLSFSCVFITCRYVVFGLPLGLFDGLSASRSMIFTGVVSGR